MEYGDFDVVGALADLHSDEGRDPVMLVAAMPPWWTAVRAEVFAGPNRVGR